MTQLGSWEFVEMEVGRTLVVDDPVGAFSVTTYDANHCPGNVVAQIIPFLSISLLGYYKSSRIYFLIRKIIIIRSLSRAPL